MLDFQIIKIFRTLLIANPHGRKIYWLFCKTRHIAVQKVMF